MYVLTLPSISMQGLNLCHSQSTFRTYSPNIHQNVLRLHMAHMFICWIYNLPISCQLVPIVYSIIYVIFSHVQMLPLLVITLIVLDYNVTSQDPYLLYCTLYMYLLGICIRP
uniref:Putative ovule protein n=1 Tax=Solanum chacoense TaxID=4108 RepID=A0A0V0I2J0_SOLCH